VSLDISQRFAAAELDAVVDDTTAAMPDVLQIFEAEN